MIGYEDVPAPGADSRASLVRVRQTANTAKNSLLKESKLNSFVLARVVYHQWVLIAPDWTLANTVARWQDFIFNRYNWLHYR